MHRLPRCHCLLRECDMAKINWTLAAVLTLVGIAFGAGGIALAGSTKETWAAVFIEVGGALALAALLAIAEGRLVREVTKSTNEAVRRETAAINERLLRLEDLDDAQRSERARRDDAKRAELADFAQADLSVERVGALLRAAHEESMVANDDPVRVRTSPDASGHLLHMMGYSDPSKVWGIFLDFEPFEFRGQTIIVNGDPVPVPFKRATTVMWIDEPASEIAVSLEDGLRIANEPLHGFTLSYGLRQLVRMVAIVREARAADAADPRRLKGRARLLLNEDWIWTDYGLESVRTSEAYKLVGGCWGDDGAWIHASIRPPEARRSFIDPMWLDAIAWIRDREEVPVHFGDEGSPLPTRRRNVFDN